MAWTQYCGLLKSIAHHEQSLTEISAKHTECKKQLKLEGVSTMNAVNLYIALGCQKRGLDTGTGCTKR